MAFARFVCVIILGLLPLAPAVLSLSGPGTSARIVLSSSLSKRQNATTTPPQCDSTCDPIADLIPTCNAQPSECCTTLYQSGYANCLVCVGVADNTTAAGFAQAQGLIDNFTITCSELGFALPKLTLPDQNPNRTLSTVSAGSGHSTLSGAQITVSSLPVSLGGNGNAPTPTISQKTVTSLPGPPPSGSATAPAAPTSSGGTQINSARRIGSSWVLIAGLFTTLYYTYVG